MAVITGRDRLAVGLEPRELAARIGLLRQGRDPPLFGLSRSGTFDPDGAVRALVEDEDWERHLVPYLMRPGDRVVCRALSRRPLALRGDGRDPAPRRRRSFPSAWVTDCTASHRVASAYEGSYAFPLYLGAERRPNLAPDVLDELARRYGSPPEPEEVFGFAYSQLWDRRFHERFADELSQDWPRVLFPGSFERFDVRARLGWKLARIHLGWERAGSRPWLHGELPVRLPAEGKTFEHDGEGRLYLGLGDGYLAPVSAEAMALTVGGYPVVPGWIRRRAGRRLHAQPVEELCRLLGALEATRRIQRELTEMETERHG